MKYPQCALSSIIIYTVALLCLTGCIGRPVALLRPNGVAVASDGSLLVMDRGNARIVHLDADGVLLGQFGRLGVEPNDIYAGWDIALDSQGNIYICNHIFGEDGGSVIHDGVKVFGPDGRLLRELGGRDYQYADGIVRDGPYGVEIDQQDRLYVANYDTNVVEVFDGRGQQITTLFGQKGDGDGQFRGLNDVAVDDQRGLLYAIDNVNSRVQQFRIVSDSGTLSVSHQLTIGRYGREQGQFSYPQYLAVDDRSGRLYVADMGNYRVQAFSPDGRFLASFAPPDITDWQVLGLAVANDGSLYASDSFNNVIWHFEVDGRVRKRIELQP